MIFAYPFLLFALAVAFFFTHQARQRGRRHTLDLGLAFALVLLLYGFIPGLGFLLANSGVGSILDSRVASGFDVDSVESVQWAMLMLVAGFTVAYALSRQRLPRQVFDHRHTARKLLPWAVTGVAMIYLGLWVTRLSLGIQSSADYIGSYLELRSAPLIVQQLYGIANQMSFAMVVAAIVLGVAARPARHLRVAAVIGLLLVYTIVSGGSRTMAFLSFFAYMAAASIYVRGYSMAKLLPAGALALALFMVAGLFRDEVGEYSPLSLLQSGEFTSLFVNAVDLKERFDDGFSDEMKFAFYLVDVLRLIPSQLTGDIKLDPATWYVETFYTDFYDAGGGLAFGVLAESMAGFGAAEAAVRGVLLGLVFAWLSNRLLARNTSILKVIAYVWTVVMCYQSFRDTTFSLVTRAFYQLMPVLLLLWAFKPRRRGSGKQARAPEPPSQAATA